ncbi:hypothetical protein M569_04452, partial [Genlisea aurea]
TALKLINELNLFPKQDANVVIDLIPDHNDAKSFSEPISEKLISLADSPVGDLAHHAGYFTLPNTTGARMFYYFFESRSGNRSEPVVAWLTGGPGCSGSLALFYENGPFQITSNLSLVWNEFGWDQVSNLIYVDQPIGTGFSYTSSSDDIRSTSSEAAVDFYNFLEAFFEKHPEYSKNEFYLIGESYAGHYVPAFASYINGRNNRSDGIYINLKGIGIGNGLTNSGIQYKADPDYALNMKLIDHETYDSIEPTASECERQAEACGNGTETSCSDAFRTCNTVFSDIVNSAVNGNINYYDVRKQCEGSLCYDFSNLDKFLNLKSVKEALGVGQDIDFVSCSTAVYDEMANDFMKNYEDAIPQLLRNGIRTLIYAGEYDLICNWLGNERWVEEMVWEGQAEFRRSTAEGFTVDGREMGLKRTTSIHGELTFLKVYNAGHLVPMDQPKASLEMLRRFI